MVVFRERNSLENSLPPNVWGQIRGRLILKVDEIFWIGSCPGEVSVVVQWWGDPAKYTFHPQDVRNVASPRQRNGITKIDFDICTSRALFESYLRNCEKLAFHVLKIGEETGGKPNKTSKHLGTAVYSDMIGLCSRGQCESYCPIFNDQLARLGDLKISIELEFFRNMKKIAELKSKELIPEGILKPSSGKFNDKSKNPRLKDEEFKRKEDNDEKERALSEVINRGNELRKAMMMSVLKDCPVGEIETVIKPDHIEEVVTSARNRRSKYLAEGKDARLIDYLLGKDMSEQDEALALKTLHCISPTQSIIDMVKPSACSNIKNDAVCYKEDVSQNKTSIGERGISSQGGSSTTSKTVVSYSEPNLRETHSSQSTEENDPGSLMDSINCYRLTIESIVLNSMGLRKVNHGMTKSKKPGGKHHLYPPVPILYTVEYSEPYENNEVPKPIKVKQFKFESTKHHDSEIIFGSKSEHHLNKDNVFSWSHFLYRVLGGTVFRVLWRRFPQQKMGSLLGSATAPSKVPPVSSSQEVDDTKVIKVQTRLRLPLLTNIGMTAGYINVFVEIGKDMKHFGHDLLESKESDYEFQDSSDNYDTGNTQSKADAKLKVSSLKQLLIFDKPVKHPTQSQKIQDLISCDNTIEHEKIKRPESSKVHSVVKDCYKGEENIKSGEHGESVKCLKGRSNLLNLLKNQQFELQDLKNNPRTHRNKKYPPDEQRNLYPTVIEVPPVKLSSNRNQDQGVDPDKNLDFPESNTQGKGIHKAGTSIEPEREVEKKLSKSRKHKSLVSHLCRAQEADIITECPEPAGSSEIPKKWEAETSSKYPEEATRDGSSPENSKLPEQYPRERTISGLHSKHCCFHSHHPCCCPHFNSRMADETSKSNKGHKNMLGIGKYHYAVGTKYNPLEEEYDDYHCCSDPMEYGVINRASKSRMREKREEYGHHSGRTLDDEIGMASDRRRAQKIDHLPSRNKVEDLVQDKSIDEISNSIHDPHTIVCHEITLCIDRVTDFPLFLNGSDLDCFVSYSFPTVDSVITGSSKRTTEVTSGSSDTSFNKVFGHNMRIELIKTLAMVLNSWNGPIDESTGYSSNPGGITLNIWARKYDHHPKDYIVATALLPYSKLFAMEMKFNKQKDRKLTIKETLLLPLTLKPCLLTSELRIGETRGVGSIQITVSYNNYTESQMNPKYDFHNTKSHSSAFNHGEKRNQHFKQTRVDSMNENYSLKTDKSSTSSLNSLLSPEIIDPMNAHNYGLASNKPMFNSGVDGYDSKMRASENMVHSTTSKRNWVLDEPTKLEKDGSSGSSVVDAPLPRHLSTILEGSGIEEGSDLSSRSKKTDFDRLNLKYDLKDLDEGNFEEAGDDFSEHGSFEGRIDQWRQCGHLNDRGNGDVGSDLGERRFEKVPDPPRIVIDGEFKKHTLNDKKFEAHSSMSDGQNKNKPWNREYPENSNVNKDRRQLDLDSRIEVMDKFEEAPEIERNDYDEDNVRRVRVMSGMTAEEMADFDDKSTQTSETLGFHQEAKSRKFVEKSKISRGSNTDLVYAECEKGKSSDKNEKEELFFARVEIERAFNLPMRISKGINGHCRETFKKPSTFVSFLGYADGKSKEFKTKVIAHDNNPIWDTTWEVMLPARLLHKCDSPMKFIVHDVSTHDSPSTSSCSSVKSHLGEVVGGIGFVFAESSREGGGKCFADVDLTPLSAGLPFLCGWFYLSNYSRSCGQIKISVTPLEDISQYRSRWVKEYSLKRYQEVDCVRLSGSTRSSEVYLAQGLYSRLPHLLNDSSDLMYSQVSEVDLFKASGDNAAPTELPASASAITKPVHHENNATKPEVHQCIKASADQNMDMMTTSFMALSLKEKLSELEAMTEGMKKKLNQDNRKINSGNNEGRFKEDTKKDSPSRPSFHQCPLDNKHFEDIIENMGQHPRKKKRKRKSPDNIKERTDTGMLEEQQGRVFHTDLLTKLGLNRSRLVMGKEHCWNSKDSLEEDSSSDSSAANPDETPEGHICPQVPSQCSSVLHQDQNEEMSTEVIHRVMGMLRTASPCQSTSRKEPDGGSRTGHHNQDDEEEAAGGHNERRESFVELTAEEIERLVQKFKAKLMQSS